MTKIREFDEVIDRVQDGMTIMIGGFLGVGSPLLSLEKLSQKKVKNLTVIAIVNAYPGGNFDLSALFEKKQISKFITAHAGTCPEAVKAYKNGEIEIEYYPMGTLIEKIRASGAGLGAVVTPIGIGTRVELGKEKLTIDGREYLVELPLHADIAFIKGFRADPLGNVQYRGIAMNSNPVIASAADFTVAEVNEIVNIGDIEPERVGTPGIFVNAIVKGHSLPQQNHIYQNLWVNSGYLR